MSGRRILFVRSGGGMPGLDIHAGITLALNEAGIFPTETSGTSAGAIICAMEATGHNGINLASILRGLRDEDVRHERACWGLRFPWLDSIMLNDRIRQMMETYIAPTWDKLKHPFHAWATDEEDGRVVDLAGLRIAPCPVDAALASMSIAGIFPPVTLGTIPYIDGGPRRNLPMPSDWYDYDEIYLLVASNRLKCSHHTGILARLIRNFEIALYDQCVEVVDEFRLDPKVTVIWPDLPTKGMLRFDHDLIIKARDFAADELRHKKFCSNVKCNIESAKGCP